MTQPPAHPAGRQSLLTPELRDQIVRVVRAGNYLKTAAQFCGIGNSTLMLWLSKGRAAADLRERGEPVPDSELRYLELLEAITQAETAAEVAAVTHWRAAFADDWRAARDFLTRKNPAAWAATTRVQISQEEADRRIELAAEQVLVAVGVDTAALSAEHLLDGDPDLTGSPLASDYAWDDDDEDDDPDDAL